MLGIRRSVAAPDNPRTTATYTATPTVDPTAGPTTTATTAAPAPSTPRTAAGTTTKPAATVDLAKDCATVKDVLAQGPNDAGGVIVRHLSGQEVSPEELAAAVQEAASFVSFARGRFLEVANQTQHARLKQLLQQAANLYGNLATALNNEDYEGYFAVFSSPQFFAMFQEIDELCGP